jgi:manganese transport protein
MHWTPAASLQSWAGSEYILAGSRHPFLRLDPASETMPSDSPNSTVQDPPSTLFGSLRHLGPGLIITASIVGSGELILTTKLGAEAGFTLLWLIVLGCMVKVFIQVELGRYAVSSSCTTLRALDGIPGPRFVVSWILWCWFVMFIGMVFQVSGIVGSLADIFPLWISGIPLIIWVWLMVASVVILLASGRYRLVEVSSAAMVFLFTVSILVAVVLLQWTAMPVRGEDILEGIQFSLVKRDGTSVNFTTAFAAIGITGVGASELIYYPYWCLEKGYGRHIGPRDDSPQWLARARGWCRVMQLDAWVSMAVYTTVTAAFYLLGAAVLHGQNLKVEDKELIRNLSEMYLTSFGRAGFDLFLVGAFFVLYSTFFVATASNARLLIDSLGLLKVLRTGNSLANRKILRAACIFLPVASGLIFSLLRKPVTLVLVGAIGQACMLPLLAGSALYFRYRKTDRRLAPGPLWTAFLWVSFLSMAALGIYQVIDNLT